MIQVSGPVIWNRIPEEIQEAGSIFTFKKNLKLHIFDQYRGDPEDTRSNSNNNNNNNINSNNIRSNNNNRASDNQRWRLNVNQPFVSRWNVDG